MKLLFTLLMAAAATAQAGIVHFALTNFTSAPLPSNTVIQLFYTNQPTISGSWITTGKPIRINAPYGVVSTNLQPGDYSMTVEGIAWPSPLRFSVGTNASYNLSEIATNASVVTSTGPFVLGITNTDGTVTITPSNGKGMVTISATGGTSPTNGVTALQATNIAASVAADTNTALLSVIATASNAAFSSAVAVAGSSVTASNTGLPESFYLAAGAVPMLGWHSWNTQGRTNLWATNILAAIDGFYTNGLVPFGWNWVEIDDNVFTSTNAQGLLIPDATRWPNGIKHVVDYAHARGIKVMLYAELGKYTDGMSFTTNADGSYVWPSYGTQNKHVENGHQFASWGIDGVWTHGDWTSESTAEQSYKRMIDFYRAVSTNHPIYFISINSKPQAWEAGGDLLRPENSQNWSCWYPGSGISQDIATDLLPGMEMLIDVMAQPVASRTIRPGHHVFFGVYPLIPSWLRMGFGGCAMFPGPLMITTWPSEWKNLPLATQQIMTNSDFIAILQDKDVKPAVKVLDMPTLSYDWIKAGYIPVNPNATNVISAVTNSVWYRPLSTPGSFAVFCMNRGSNSANIYFSRTNFPVAPTTYKMFDVWARTNMADLTNQTVTVSVPSNSISIYRLSLPLSTSTTVADTDISIPLILENPVADNGGGNAWVLQITNSANATGMKMGQIFGNQGWHGIQLWNGPQFGHDTCSLLGTTNQTAFGVPNSGSLFTWRAGTKIIASMQGTGATYLNGIGITNIPLTGVSGLPAALAWLTNNTGGGTGAVSSVNGLTGAVTLDAAAVGAQPALGFAPQYGTENGTNWSAISTNIITDLRQEITDTTLDFVPQYGSANLTNLSAYGVPAFLTWTNWNPGDPADLDIVRMQPIIGGSVVAGGWIDFWKTTEEWHVGQIVHAPEFIGSMSAANLTGTIDPARLPSSVTNSIVGGISLSNQTAIYMLSITENTTLSAFGNVHASEFRTASLWITNGTANTYTLALPAGTSCPDGTTLYCTNGQRRVVSVGGIINFTNALSRWLP